MQPENDVIANGPSGEDRGKVSLPRASSAVSPGPKITEIIFVTIGNCLISEVGKHLEGSYR